MRVLDAGCGREQLFERYPGAHIVGLDIDEAALALNNAVDEKIVGDVQAYPLEQESFDAIVCWYLLEHLPRPEAAIANMAQALKPGGELVIGVPNLLSPKGIVTKLTPLRFHTWFYKHVFNNRLAGREGFGPYKTYLRWQIRPQGLRKLATRYGLRVEGMECFDSHHLHRIASEHPVVAAIIKTLWPGDPFLTEVRVVLRKPVTGS